MLRDRPYKTRISCLYLHRTAFRLSLGLRCTFESLAPPLEVMKTELADRNINAKLVAAYLIGYPNMPKTFPQYPYLRTAQGADDTGVIITYNSQTPGKVKSPFTGKGDVYCINPVNWRTDDKIAEKTEHQGSRFFDFKTGKATDKKSFVSAKIDPVSGGLIVIPAVMVATQYTKNRKN